MSSPQRAAHPDTPRPAKRRRHVPRLVRANPRPILTVRRPSPGATGEPTFADRLLLSVKEIEKSPATRVGGQLTPSVRDAELCARGQAERLMQYLRLETSWVDKKPRFSDYSGVWCIYEQLVRDSYMAPVPRDWGAFGQYAKSFSFTEVLEVNRIAYDDGSEEFARWERDVAAALSRVYRDLAESLRRLGYRVVAPQSSNLFIVALVDRPASRGSTEPDDE